MSFSSHFRGYFQNWLYGKIKQQPLQKRLKKTPLLLELLEDRTVMSALPAAVVGNSALNFESLVPAFPWGGPSIRTQATNPQVIVDPLDPNKIVEVHAVFLVSNIIPATHLNIYNDVPEGVNAPQWVLEGDYSTDQGRSWTFFSVAQAISDPADFGLNNVPYASIQDVSASFDRNHHFYVVSLQHNNPGAAPDARQTHISGAIVMQRFDFSGAAPVQDLTLGSNGTTTPGIGFFGRGGTFTPGLVDPFSPGSAVIYQWYDQDPAANPVVGIDNNLPTFTDPVTGALQTDSMATMVSIPAVSNPNVSYPADLVPKAIYVAYNVLQTFPQPPSARPIPLESRVFMAASADGGRQFTNQELVSDLLHFSADFIPKDLPNFVPVTQSGTEASSPQIVFTQGAAQRPSYFVYNGQRSANFFFNVATATPSAIQSILDTIPGLTGDTTVTYIGGGSTVKNVAGATFNITFKNGAFPYLLSYDGPGALNITSSTVSAFTGVSATVGGQVMVFYNDIFNGFDRIYYDSSRPDAGNPATPVAAASIFTSGEVFMPIADGITGKPNVAGVTDVPINVDFSTTGINGINLDKVTDLTVTVNLIDNLHMDELAIILIPPPGLPSVNLLLNRIDLAGMVIGGGNPQGLPAVANGAIGEIPVPTNPITYVPVGTVFDDNAPRYLTDGVDGFFNQTAFNPYIGHFQPEENNPNKFGLPGFLGSPAAPYRGMGALQALIASPNFMTLAKGTWTLRMLDFRATPTPPAFIQILDNWSLNFTGRIATTQGAFSPLTPFPNYGGFPGGKILGVTLPEDSFPGGTGGFGIDIPISLPFPLPIPPDTPGAPNDVITTIPGAALGIYPNNSTVAPAGTPGIGPIFSVAIDNTLGSFSPFQGRVYVAYTSGSGLDTNISLVTSDFPLGATDTSITPSTLEGASSSTDHWTIQPALGKVNDDAPGDNFTGGNRTQFNPNITVDPVTGTLGLMWYDGRFDAAHARVANAFTTSIDGGVTFAPDTFLNTKQTATDFYTGVTILQEPVPDNMALASAFGFSDRSGLAMYGGRVYPAFSGNLDQPKGNITINGLNATPGSMIFTNTVTVAGGPRLLSGDMGPLVNDFNNGNTVYNNTFTTDATRQLNGFVLTFDRPVDPGTLTPNLINITYRDPNTPAGAPGTDLSSQITGITPLDLSAAHGPNVSGTPPSLSISDTIVQEPFTGRTVGNFTVILSQAVGTPVAVDWTTQDDSGGTAAQSTGLHPDYVASHGTLVFKPGQLTASFQVPVLNDIAFTSNRHFLVNLSNAPAAIVIDRGQGKGTIVSNQNIPALTVGNAYVQKNATVNPVINFPVFLNAPASADISVDFSFSDGTAKNGIDYNGVPGILTILKGNTVGIITATAISNQRASGNLNFFLNLTNPVNASVTRTQAVGVIVDDNALAVSVGDVTVQRTPASQTANVTFYLNGVTSQDVTVRYRTVAGTAVDGTDYTGTQTGSIVIPKGSQTVTVPITILGSTTAANNLTFQVQITKVVNASIAAANASATVTIIDDNVVPAVFVADSIVRQNLTGTATTVDVPIYLTFVSLTDIKLNIQTSAFGTNQAIPGKDFIPLPAQDIIIPAGQSKGIVTVTLPTDLRVQLPINPTFAVTVNSVGTGNATIARKQGIVTIVSDTVQVSVGDITVQENTKGNATARFQVFLSGPSELPISVTLATGGPNDTAVAGTDYIQSTQTITFAPGQIVAPVNVTVLHNLAANGDPVFFTLNVTGIKVGGLAATDPNFIAKDAITGASYGSGNGTIVDADGTAGPFITIGDVTRDVAPAFGGPVTFSFPVFSDPPVAALSVTVTAVAPGIVPINAVVTPVPNAAGQFVVDVLVRANNPNGITQPFIGNRQFTVTVSAPTVGSMSAKAVGIGKIIDDNATTINIGNVANLVGRDPNKNTEFDFPVVVSNAAASFVPTVFVDGNYFTADGTATVAEKDYIPVFADPSNFQFFKTSDKFPLPVFVPGTTTPEVLPAYETFTATLANTFNAYPPNPTGTAFIIDSNLLNLSVSDTSVQETPTGASMDFTVYLNGISGADVSFTWALNDGTAKAGIDYGAPTSATATIPAGTLFKKITIPINRETAYKGNRFFTMTLSKPTNAGIQKAVGTGTIMDNELTPTLTLSDAIVKKGPTGQQQATFTVFANYPIASAATPTGLPTTMTILLSDLTATAAEGDYVNTPITVTLPAGATSATFNVPINGDTNAEGNEAFRATITNPSNGDLLAPRIADQDKGVLGEGIATIVDFNSVTAVNIGDLVVTKRTFGQQTVNIPILLTTPSPVPVTFQVDTSDGTAKAARFDYVPIVGQIITIPANTTSFSIPVIILGNSNPTGDLGFFVTLSNPQNATIVKDKATVTIVDPNGVLGATQFLVSMKPQGAVGTYSYTVQPLVSDRIRLPFGQGGANLTISNVTVQDNASEAVFTLLLSQANPQAVTVRVTTADGSAVAGKDYTPVINQLVTFAPGSSTATVRVPLVNIGTTIEPFRTFTLSATNLAVGGAPLPASSILDVGTASIVDRNDQSKTTWSIGDGVSRAGPGASVSFNIFTNGSFATWTPQGPVPDLVGRLDSAGAVQSIAVDPNNPAHIVVGAVNGGIWQTFNADPNNPKAITWTAIGDTLKSLSIGDVVFDATDKTGKTFYAGTGLWTNNFNTGGSAVGLYKTTDGGQTWTLLGQSTLTGRRIRAIDVSGQTILLGTVNGTGTAVDPSRDYSVLGGGLFRSTDGGASFAQVVGASGSTLPTGPVVSVVTDPNTAGRVYVAVGGQGIYRSDNALSNASDSSVIWAPVNTGLAAATGSLDVEMVSQSIAGATTLYAGIIDSNNAFTVYTSTNGGNQWTQLAAVPAGFNAGIGFAEKFNLVADPAVAGVVYIDGESGSIQGSPGILRYNPAGAGNWVEIDGSGTATGSAPHPDSRDLQFIGKNTLVESDDGGIYVLPDAANSTGSDWSSFNGNINDVELFSVNYDSTNNILFGGSQDNGSPVQSAPGSLLWKDQSSGDGQFTAIDTTSRANGNVLRYVLSNNWSNLIRLEYDNANNLVSSTNVGLRAFPGFFNGSGLNGGDQSIYFSGNFVFQPYVLNSVDPRQMLLGFFGVYESANPASGDAGDVITDITSKVGNTDFVTSLVYGGTRAGIGYTNVAMVGTRSGQLFFRGETGTAFTEVDGAGAGKLGGTGPIVSMAVDPTDWRAVYVIRGSQLWFTPNITNLAANPFRAVGNGAGDNLGLLTSDLTAVTVVRVGTTSLPLVGALGGVYRMTAPGVWSLYGQGLPNVVVHNVVYNATQDLLIAGTFGRGAWTITNASTTLLSTAPLQSSTAQTILVTTNDPSGSIVPLTSFPVTLPANSSSVTVTIPLKPGVVLPANLNFTVSIASPSAGIVGQKPLGTGILVADSKFDTTRLSATPINWQAVVPVSITQGNTVPAQQNVPINAAALPVPSPPKPSVPYVATSTINISGISANQVLRDLTVNVNAEFPDTTGLLVQLIAPNGGPTYTLAQNEPGSNFPGTVFDDQALNPISLRTRSSVQTVTVDATGGTFTLLYNGSLVTPALPWNASAAAVQFDLENLLSIQPGSVTVTLEASKDPNAARVYTISFEGLSNPPLLTANGNPLTGNSHSATVAPLLPLGLPNSFRPETPLSANALPASQLNGAWTLRITNSSTANFGTLSDWSLRLQTGVFSSALTPNDPNYSGSLGNAMDQVQQAFTASLTRDPTSIFAVPNPVGGVPLSVTAPFLSPPYDPATLPLIIPGPHQDAIKYTTADVVQTLTFGPNVTGGTFTLSFNGQTTAPISWSSSTTFLQSNIQSALNTLTTIGQGNTVVSNAANPTITFVNAFSGSNVPALTFDGSGLVGGSIASLTRSTVGTPANPLNLDIPKAINDPHTNVVTPGVLNVPIVVANAPIERVLTGLTVRIDVQHPFAADLRISLVAPDGTTVLLSNQNGAGGFNLDGTTFDDSAAIPITAAAAPFQGTYAPQQPLSTFYGKNINGTWNLRVEDMKADGQHGQVLYWQLIPTSGLILNQTNTYADVVFDRQINLSTIDASNISNMLGPIGQIAGPFTVTPNPTAPGTSTPVYPPEYLNRVFRITFPVQQYSGSYSLVVGPVNNTVNPLLNKTIKDLAGNAIDNNLNAGLYVARGASPTAAATVTKSYSTPIINQVFSPGGAAFSTITVPDDYIITQDDINHIQLQLAVKHQNTPDLIATLTAPDGTVVTLFTHVGVNQARAGDPHPDPGNPTTFDDFAVNVIQTSSVGLLGTYKPQTPLSLLKGKNAKGTWALTIFNEAKNPANTFSIGTFTGTLVQWSLTFPSTVPGTGLGETGADQINTGFRIFTTSPANTLSSSVWTAIGPAAETGGQSGPVGAITVDPADSTGNTVYAAGAKGGVWKTYNFMTTDPKGPNWIPLTDLGPLNGLNIGTLTAVASADGDPNKTMILAGTGTAVTTSATSNGLPITNAGIGFLRSTDGGRTWQVIDSSNNNLTTDPITLLPTGLPISSPLRNHLFDGAAINKIVIDPAPLNGKFVVYAAISGTSAANSGLFRSLDSGVTWTQMEAGICTDVVLAGGSGSGGSGQMQVLYAGFMTGFGTTGGVYFTSSAVGTPLNTLLPVPNNGSGTPGPNQGVNSRVNIDPEAPPFPSTVITVGNSTNPSGTTTPIVLATPAKTNQPLKDALYQGWVYAYTNNTLYETKDFGQNWTQVNLPITSLNPLAVSGDKPTNDTTQPNFTLGVVKSIVIDPSNPNIIYIGGTNPIGFHGLGQNQNNGTASSVVRVDLTNVSDVYSFVNYDYSDPTGILPRDPSVGDATGTGPGAVFHDFGGSPTSNVLTMLRDPANPFLAPSSLQFTNTLAFRNDGSGVHWQFFDFGQGSVNQMVSITDPLTGNIRLFSATSTGVYTGVDIGEGAIDPGIGSAASVSGSRIGNLQVGQITTTGAQPSTLAGAVSGALLYAENPNIGIPMSDPNIFQDGNLTWRNLSSGYGEAIVPDPSGSGTVFRYQYPYTADYPLYPTTAFSPLNGNDFFEVNPPGTVPGPTDQNAIGTASAGTGLIQAGDFPATTGAGQWPGFVNQGSNFAINSLQNTDSSGNAIDYPGLVMSSRAGRIFRASNISLAAGVGGIVWQDVGDPNVLDGTYAPAVAFGSPTQIAGRNVDDFIYVGTLKGNVFITTTGGGTNWLNISGANGLDGSPVLSINPDPTRGSHKVFALTQKALYYCADSSAATPVWTRLNDTAGKTYIFPNATTTPKQTGIQRPVWNNAADLVPAFDVATGLTSVAVDWRFALADATGSGTHPVLYVGADGGVVNSTDLGATWSIFPNLNFSNPATQTGGYLPSVRVTDLKLILGNTNAVTGVPDTSTGLNMLVASTFGRGDFAIRLDTSAYASNVVIPNSGPQVASVAPATGTFGEFMTGITVTFKGAVDPTSFSPADVASVIGPNGAVPVQYVFDVTPSGGPGTGNLHNIYQIVFLTPQIKTGTYTVTLGPNISDFSGNLMNQNGNGVNGEASDRFIGTVSFVANTPPTISVIQTQQSAPGTPITVSFTVADTTDAAATLTLAPPPTSSNTDLVPDGNIVIGNVAGTNGAGHTLTITPVGNQPGATLITVSVTDPHGLTTSESFELIFGIPVVLPANPGPQTIPHGQTLTLPFNVTGSTALALTVNATAIAPAYNLWTKYQFFKNNGTYYQNSFGRNEKWLFSNTNNSWYIIQPTGLFSIWNGGNSFSPVATDQFGNPLLFDNSYWLDPTKLTAPAAPITFAGSIQGTNPTMTLTLPTPITFVGAAVVTVSANDGLATSSLTFPLTVTNAPPKFNTIGTPTTPGGIPALSVSPAQPSLSLHLADAAANGGFALTDADDGVAGVTLDGSKAYAANPAGIAYELSQTYALYFTGNYYFNSSGLGEKWLQSRTTGDWYIIQSSGAFSHWNGGSSFTQFATLDNSYWQDPTKIVSAPEPTPLAGSTTIDDANHIVSVVPASQTQVVKIAAFDGQATTTQFFDLNVAATPPVFNVPDQQLAHNASGTPQLQINLANQPASPAGAVNLTDPNGLPFTTTLAVYNFIPGEAYKLSTTLDLQFHTSTYQNLAGRVERWLYGQAAASWFIIEPNGNFSKWNGGSSFTLVAKLDHSYWNNINSLININDGNHVVAPTPLASTAAFTFADNANVLTFNTDGTVAGNYLASVTATDALSTTTHSFELSLTDIAPTFTLATPGSTTISHTASYDAAVSNVTDGDVAIGGALETPTFSANVYPYVPGIAYELQQTYGFYTTGNYFSTGTAPKWFRSAANNSWYTIDKTGLVSNWNGGSSFTQVVLNGVPVVLTPEYYGDPTKLFNTSALPAPLSPAAITAVFSGSNAAGYDLHLQPISSAGNLLVQVNATDTAATTSQYFALTVVSPTPSFTVTPQTPSVAFTNQATAFVTGISAAPDPLSSVTFTASVFPLVPGLAYQLNQQKAFVFNGTYYLNSAGLGEKWVYSNTEANWYIIEPTGKLSKWNGGTSFTQVVLDGVPVVLGPDYWADPSKLYNANTPPPDLAKVGTFTTSFTGTNATGLTLTVNPNSRNAGDYLVQVNGSDAGAIFSQYFAQNFSDFAPTFGQPADQSIAHATATLTLDLTNPASFANPSAIPSPVLSYAEGLPAGNLATVTLGVKAYYATPAGVAYELNSQLNLFTTGNYYVNSLGLGEKWVRSHVNNQWYIIEPSGKFSVWNGGSSVTFTAQLDSSYYGDPTKLFSATEPQSADLVAPPQNPAPGSSSPLTTPAVLSYGADNTQHTVTVNTDPGFVGILLVKVTASDPAGLATTRFFKLSATSLTPTLSIKPAGPLALSKAGTAATVELVGNDPDSNNSKPLNYVVTVTDVSAAAQAFALQQAQNLFVDGSLFFNYYGQQEIWLRSRANGAWYGITPDGTVHLLDTAHLLGPVVANLGAAYYNNYNLLLGATNPGSPSLSKQLSPAFDASNPDAMNLQLAWTNPSFPSSGSMPVLVSVTVTNSVGASTTQTFVVNVS